VAGNKVKMIKDKDSIILEIQKKELN
jgi:hypothetical protein